MAPQPLHTTLAYGGAFDDDDDDDDEGETSGGGGDDDDDDGDDGGGGGDAAAALEAAAAEALRGSEAARWPVVVAGSLRVAQCRSSVRPRVRVADTSGAGRRPSTAAMVCSMATFHRRASSSRLAASTRPGRWSIRWSVGRSSY
jgi:hypothetical protein